MIYTCLIFFFFCNHHLTQTFAIISTGQDLVPEPQVQIQEAVQERRGPPGAQPQRQRLHGLQLPAVPVRGVGGQHSAEHPDQQTPGPAAADAQLVTALHGGLQ